MLLLILHLKRPSRRPHPPPTNRQDPADLTITLTKLTITLTKLGLLQLIASRSLDHLQTKGDPQVWTRLLALTDRPDTDLPIVTP
jgi:hypothetical protein